MKKYIASFLRFYKALLLAVVICYAGLIVYAYVFANGMIFPISESSYVDDPGIRKLTIPTGENISVKNKTLLPEPILRFYTVTAIEKT